MTHIATRRQFSRNVTSGWLLLAAEVVAAFVLTPFLIRSLGAPAYGVWSLMIGLVGYMGLIDIGIRGSVGRYINHYLALQDRRALGEVVGTATVVLSALALLALLAAVAIGSGFDTIFPKTPPELLGPVRVCLPLMALGLWLAFVSSVLGNLLAAREALYLTNHLGLVVLVARVGATVAVLVLDGGLVGLMAATLAANTLQAAGTFWLARRRWAAEMPPLLAFSAPRLREMWRYGVASFVARTASTMANDTAPIIGMWLLGPEAVAVYSVAMTLSQYSRRLIEQTGSAIFPSVMKAGAKRDLAGLRDIFLRYMRTIFALGSLVFVGTMVYAGDFLALWAGPAYAAGGTVAGILAFGYLMQALASTGPLSLAALDKVHVTMRIAIVEALACMLLSALLPGVLGWGLAGLALGATLPRLVFGCAVYPWLAVRMLGPELKAPLWRALGRNVVMCIVVGVVFVGMRLLLPPLDWPALALGVAIVTLLHVAALGDRYEVSAAARLNEALRALLRRRGRPA